MTTLVAYDRSEPAKKALEWALKERPTDEIIVLHVVEATEVMTFREKSFMVDWDDVVERRRGEVEEWLSEVCDTEGKDVTEITTEIVSGRPHEEIVRYAGTNDVDTVVIGTQGRTGAARALLGSVAEQVVRQSPVPVVVVR